MPNFLEMKDMDDLVRKDKNLGQESAEMTLEVLANFNQDMQDLALNAY